MAVSCLLLQPKRAVILGHFELFRLLYSMAAGGSIYGTAGLKSRLTFG